MYCHIEVNNHFEYQVVEIFEIGVMISRLLISHGNQQLYQFKFVINVFTFNVCTINQMFFLEKP